MTDLNEIKNMFYLGNYQGVINEGGNVESDSEEVKIERDVLIYRSYVAQGNTDIVIQEIKEDWPVDLQAVSILAKYFSADTNLREEALKKVEKGLKGNMSENPTFLLISSIIYDNQQNYDEALKCAHQVNSLEGWVSFKQVLWLIFLILLGHKNKNIKAKQ